MRNFFRCYTARMWEWDCRLSREKFSESELFSIWPNRWVLSNEKFGWYAANDRSPPFRDLELISCGGHLVRIAAVDAQARRMTALHPERPKFPLDIQLKFLYINSYLLLMERPVPSELVSSGAKAPACPVCYRSRAEAEGVATLSTLPPGHPTPSPGGIRAYCTTCLLRVGQQYENAALLVWRTARGPAGPSKAVRPIGTVSTEGWQTRSCGLLD
jgi:hypothetical protein